MAELKGGTFRFDENNDDYKMTGVDLGNYIEKKTLKDKSLEQLAGLDIAAVKALKELKTEENVNIFDNYVFNDEVKGLVKKENIDPNNTSPGTQTCGCCHYP